MATTPILPEEDMRTLGFTDHREGRWYYCWPVWGGDITYNLTINKATGEWEEYVLDEAFGQPYHYMTWHLADEVSRVVDKVVATLRESGLDITHDHSLYDLRKD